MATRIQLEGWVTGPETVDLFEGAGAEDFVALIPADEPIAAGAGFPPVTPDLVTAIEVPTRVRSVSCRSGERQTSPAETKPRARFEVRWTGLTLAERDELVAWFRDEVQGRLLAFWIEPDAPEPAGSGVVAVRPIAEPAYTWQTKAAHDCAVQVEEVF